MSYTLLPNSGQSLGQTRAAIRKNFELIQSGFNINHLAFDATNAGKHKFVEMPVQGSIPVILSGEGVLYTVTGGGGFTQLFYNRDLEGVGRSVQLTAGTLSGTNNTTFGENSSTGWSFLPGNLLIQYGNTLTLGNNTGVTFPIAFSQLFSVVALGKQFFNGKETYGFVNEDQNGFIFTSSDSVAGRKFCWIAIGAA